ncbi:MAG: UDP-N-acetylmuramoyl-L-alanyl-D-glutamate--2,6-diaminopimelate ligase [Patescibacteria group bacterium]|nr:UDP-N-acetylmuramoyl-L-alanyl-D-glutamate--2,6-diaminopimelate ligase [Patescibacteria group bacterium]
MKNLTKKLKSIWWALKLFLALEYYGKPSHKLKIVGVTGTNGKTTTATLLYSIAKSLGYKVGLISTVDILINGEKWSPKKGAKIPGTTPDSVTLTKLFYEMAKSGCEYVFMEVSSHAMDQNRVRGVKFAGGIFTNLTQDHLDYHKSMESYFFAKRKFFTMLPKDAFALSNDDDEHGEAMITNINATEYYYGLSDTAYFRGEILKNDFTGLEIKIGEHTIKSKLLGKFNVYNLLAVWGACNLLGFDMEKVKKSIETVEPPTGRFDHFTSSNGVMVVVDYAHTPDALEKIIFAVKDIKPQDGKLITVFGCGGDRDPLKRRIMGKIGAMLSDIAILTSDNPRSEDPEKILKEMKVDLSMAEVEKTKTIPNRLDAIKESVKLAVKGDIILCAGKGHETYQEIKGVKHHFNDMEEYKKIFN